MDRRIPGTGEIYRHFKNKLYQIVAIAEHSETGEKLVIYQALYGEYRVYARPLAMFLSEVDREKYPEAAQKYRFEQVDMGSRTGQIQKQLPEPPQVSAADMADTAEGAGTACAGEVSEGDDEAGADPRLLAFLDADTFLEKYQVIKNMENDITDRLINDFAVVLDVVIPEGALQQRYVQLKQCVATMCRYETTRLR